jgi:LAS superfamily LD-carboxypeptidase LdcB
MLGSLWVVTLAIIIGFNLKSPSFASNSVPTEQNLGQQIIAQDPSVGQDKYLEAIPADNSISRKYRSIAQQTGYIETYPQLATSIMGTSNGQRVVQDALDAFNNMRTEAAKERISLKILSGFRDLRTQVGIFERKGGGVRAAEYSAPPGHSQHHTGLAIDINSLSPSFRNTAAYRWLKNNAPRYGFMLSYENRQGDLGPKNEPWHWVYVKDPRAMRLMSCFINRAQNMGYDPLLGDPELTAVYQQSKAENSVCPS